jgi:septation ring formation regulator EzrA
MEVLYLLVGVGIGALLAAIAAAAYWKPKNSSLRGELALAESELAVGKSTDERLRETFSSLASNVLKNSSESFLTLAKETLGRHQQEAKSDLDKKQNAFAQLVKPVEETLKKVDTQLDRFCQFSGRGAKLTRVKAP